MNAVERGVVLSRSEYLGEAEFDLLFRQQPQEEELTVQQSGAAEPSLESVEKETILKALETTSGNKSEAARRLGITRRTLHLKLKKYGMM
jgi:two-component system response regulator HydG